MLHTVLLAGSTFFISSAEKLGNVQKFKIIFISRCYIPDSIYVKINLLNTVAFNKDEILYLVQ